MKQLRITATAFLLSAAVLLGGCTEHGSPNTSGENSNFSLGISEVNSSNSATGEDNSDMNSLNSTTSEEKSEINSSSSSDSAENSDQSLSTSQVLTPLSFSNEDLELQEILKDLVRNGGADIQYFFVGLYLYPDSDQVKFRFPNSRSPKVIHNYYPIPQNYRNNNTIVPTTYTEMEETINNFFTKQATARYMQWVCRGTATEASDGVFDILIEDENKPFPMFVEINGQLYRNDSAGVNTLNIDEETARVTHKEEGIIEFTFLPMHYFYDENTEYKYEELYLDHAATGYVMLEDGKWKLPFWLNIDSGFEPRQ